MKQIRIGIIIAFFSLLLLIVILINENATIIEKSMGAIFCSLLVALGIFIENGYFPHFEKEFNDEQKF